MAILRRAARTAGRTALITSVATKTHHGVASRQRGAAAQQTAQPPAPAPAPVATPAPAQPAPPAPATAASTQTMIDQLRQLGELRDAGVLTADEFEAQKAAVLAGPTHG